MPGPYRLPTRSHPPIAFAGDTNIGWHEGRLARDGRPFRLECWATDGVTSISVFLDTKDWENADDAFFVRLLEEEKIARFRAPDATFVAAAKIGDADGHEAWSVNVVIGDEERVYADSDLPLRPYPRPPPT